MSLLGFLRVIEAIRPSRGKASPPNPNRRLEMESLERRSVLALVDSLVAYEEPVETTIAIVESLPEVDALADTVQPLTEYDNGGSGSGTGGAEPGDPTIEVPSDPILTSGGSTGGSGSGTGYTEPESPPSSGSGSGSGGEAPSITALQGDRVDAMVWFVGTVTDADGPVEGLTVYFSVGSDPSVAFTAVVDANGAFTSLGMLIEFGTLVRAYTIDADGNQSELATCYV